MSQEKSKIYDYLTMNNTQKIVIIDKNKHD